MSNARLVLRIENEDDELVFPLPPHVAADPLTTVMAVVRALEGHCVDDSLQIDYMEGERTVTIRGFD